MENGLHVNSVLEIEPLELLATESKSFDERSRMVTSSVVNTVRHRSRYFPSFRRGISLTKFFEKIE